LCRKARRRCQEERDCEKALQLTIRKHKSKGDVERIAHWCHLSLPMRNNSSRSEIHTTTSNLFPFFLSLPLPHFDRLPFSALIFVRKTFSFFVYFMLRVSYDLYTQVSIFFLACFTRHNEENEEKFRFFLFLFDAPLRR
jgi:hypothetical protein